MNQLHPHRQRSFGAISLLLVASLACNLGVSQPIATGLPTSKPQDTPLLQNTVPAATDTSTSVVPTQTSAPIPATATIKINPTGTATSALPLATVFIPILIPTNPIPSNSLKTYKFYSIMPLSFSNDYFYVRHQNLLGEITQVLTDSDKGDATFEVMPGLADINCISIESYNLPAYYLRHKDFRLIMDVPDGSQLFSEDATFCPKIGLGHSQGISLESYNFPGYYIRHRDFHLYVETGTDGLFRSDATFIFYSPLAP